MLQKSVYSKIVLNGSQKDSVQQQLENNKPANGLVQLLTITEKQFQKIQTLVGSIESEVLDTDERTVII